MAGKKPSHFLYAKRKSGGSSVRIGAAWPNKWGGISIKLNPCVFLTDRDDIYLNIYENKDQEKQPEDVEHPAPAQGWSDDNVPF